MSKKYFTLLDDERCYTLAAIKDQMRIENVSELIATEAKRETKTGLFYCTYLRLPGMAGIGCGKQCEDYKPRNGKNGRCVYSGYCYEKTDKKITVKIKL